MQSEIAILEARGLTPKPDNPAPAPPGAATALQRYRTILKQFDELVTRIDSYCTYTAKPEIGIASLRLIDEASHMVVEIRHRAVDLGQYPTCFITLRSGVAYYSEIAGTADEAYNKRMLELERIELAFGRAGGLAKFKLVDLKAHKGKGQHLWSRHIGKSLSDIKQRFLDEDAYGTPKNRLSSLIDGPIAQEIVSRALYLARERIHRAKEGKRLEIEINELMDIGYVIERGSPPRLAKSGVLIIRKDSRHADGFRIISIELDT